MEQYGHLEEMLIDLIGIDTRCGLAPELPAAQYLYDELTKMNIDCTIYQPQPGRASMLACIPGVVADTVVLHAHLDTADVEPGKWRYPPLKATRNGNNIYGRGALDCKGLCAIWSAICSYIMRHRLKPQKTLLFAATADEEAGGAWGTQWLLDHTHHFDYAKLVLGEGGGFCLHADGKQYITLQTGERDQLVLKGFIDSPANDPYNTLQKGLSLGYYNEATLEYSQAKNYGKRAISHATLFENIVEHGRDTTTTYSVLPFLSKESLCISGDRILSTVSAGRQSANKEIISKIQAVLMRLGRQEVLLPYVIPGYSDNRFFRQVGIPTYGFFPVAMDNAIAGIHAANEYITQETLHMAYDILLETVLEFIMQES